MVGVKEGRLKMVGVKDEGSLQLFFCCWVEFHIVRTGIVIEVIYNEP